MNIDQLFHSALLMTYEEHKIIIEELIKWGM
jgi:hypothetical protein